MESPDSSTGDAGQAFPSGSSDGRQASLSALKAQLQRVFRQSAFYHESFTRCGTAPEEFREIDDLRKFPLLTREALQANFDRILSVPPEQVATIIETSGTTAGTPLTMAHTRHDIAMIGSAKRRELASYGVTANDVAQVTLPYGLWQGAWSTHWGLTELGACVIASGTGSTERQLAVMNKLRTTVLFATPNYHLRIAEVFREMKGDRRDLALRIGVCVAGRLTNRQIERLKDQLGYRAIFTDYGATEFPGFATQCPMHPDVHHIWSDNYFVEILDPDTHEPLPDGARGEMVITSLKKEATPLVRYLSRDITALRHSSEPCGCGLTAPRIDADICRADFMLKIRGTPLFPGQLERIAEEIPGLTGRLQIILDKRRPSESVTVKVETFDPLSAPAMDAVREKILGYAKTYVGITINELEYVPHGTFGDKYKKSVVIATDADDVGPAMPRS